MKFTNTEHSVKAESVQVSEEEAAAHLPHLRELDPDRVPF